VYNIAWVRIFSPTYMPERFHICWRIRVIYGFLKAILEDWKFVQGRFYIYQIREPKNNGLPSLNFMTFQGILNVQSGIFGIFQWRNILLSRSVPHRAPERWGQISYLFKYWNYNPNIKYSKFKMGNIKYSKLPLQGPLYWFPAGPTALLNQYPITQFENGLYS